MKPTNDIRELIRCISKDIIPANWKIEFPVPKFVTLTLWINQIFLCLKYLSNYKSLLLSNNDSNSSSNNEVLIKYWLGNMFTPEAFITAIRQQSAQVIIMYLSWYYK